ncbi:MAG: hypothetical protein K2N87_02495 [Eubacterium sp.]|nr:hypothetical protein [Eubacterium sp.]
MKEFKKRIILGIVFSVCFLIPLMVYQFFYVDYVNHTWEIDYYADFFKNNGRFPIVIHTSDTVGIAYPQFYGYLFYQGMGFLTFIVGNSRIAYVLSSMTIFTLIFFLFSEIFIHILRKTEICAMYRYAIMLSFLIICNPYILTNLYSRNAMTEYYAVLCMYLAAGSWILSFFKEDTVIKLALWSLAALSVTFMLGTHPITAEWGGVICICMVVVTIPFVIKQVKDKKCLLAAAFGEAVLIIMAVSPWLYVTVCNLSQLAINEGTGIVADIAPYLDSNYLTRLMVFPMDARSLTDGIRDVSTPYLDLQINMPLAILYAASWIWVVCSKKIAGSQKGVSAVLLFLSIIMLVCSATNSPLLLGILCKVFRHIQFSYRLIAYVDILVVFGLLYHFFILARSRVFKEFEKKFTVVLIVCVTLSGHNLLIQIVHAQTTANQVIIEKEPVTSLPETFYGITGYCDVSIPSMDKNPPDEMIEVKIPVSLDGLTSRAEFDTDKKIFVSTNIQSAKYNKIYLDGVRLHDNEIVRYGGRLAFYANSGHHFIDYAAEFPYIFNVLRKLSYIAVFLLLLIHAFSWVWYIRMIRKNKHFH